LPQKPNYDFERKERDRQKSAKKAEKLATKKAVKAPQELERDKDVGSTDVETPSS